MKKAIVIALLLVSVASYAGKLDDFEKAPEKSPKKVKTSEVSESSSEGDSILAATIIDVFFGTLFAQNTAASVPPADPMVPQSDGRGNLRGETTADVNRNLRKNYSFALPNIRFDSTYFYDPDGINAFRVKGEGGYLMIAADIDYTRFYENNSRLNDLATHGLFRIPLATEFLELDVALGYRRVWGSQLHQGFDFGLPFYVNIGKWVQLDARYYITYLGDKLPLQEVDAGVAGKYKWVGARAGYRYIKVKGASPIQGPEVGLFVQW